MPVHVCRSNLRTRTCHHCPSRTLERHGQMPSRPKGLPDGREFTRAHSSSHGSILPHTRSRATPPSGKMFSRTCVTGPRVAEVTTRRCRAGPELGAGHELLPGRVLTRRPAGARGVAPVETRALREVALEVGRVQVDALDHAAPAEPQH